MMLEIDLKQYSSFSPTKIQALRTEQVQELAKPIKLKLT